MCLRLRYLPQVEVCAPEVEVEVCASVRGRE
jgi:hypothetical protein